MGRIETDIALESWLLEFCPCLRLGHLPYPLTLIGLTLIYPQQTPVLCTTYLVHLPG